MHVLRYIISTCVTTDYMDTLNFIGCRKIPSTAYTGVIIILRIRPGPRGGHQAVTMAVASSASRKISHLEAELAELAILTEHIRTKYTIQKDDETRMPFRDAMLPGTAYPATRLDNSHAFVYPIDGVETAPNEKITEARALATRGR
ncbi:hypothetical protein RBB50_003936 [Rhinocladiella similis]